MDALMAEWQFLVVVLGAVFTYGGLAWAVRRHAKILNGGMLGRIEKNLATLIERADTHAEDIRLLRTAVEKETDKREAGVVRIHARLDECRGSKK